MARTFFHDFIDEARETFDLSYQEALDYYRDWMEQAEEEAEAEAYYEEPEQEEPEVDWFDDLEYVEWDIDDVEDYWLDEGDEIEITADLAYEEGK